MSRFFYNFPNLIIRDSGRVTTFEAWPSGLTRIEIREYEGSEKYIEEFIEQRNAEQIIEYLKLRYDL